MRVFARKRLNDIKAIEPWHFNVEQQQIRLNRSDQFERFRPALNRTDQLEALNLRHHVADAIKRDRLIIYRNDAKGSHERRMGSRIVLRKPPVSFRPASRRAASP